MMRRALFAPFARIFLLLFAPPVRARVVQARSHGSLIHPIALGLIYDRQCP